MKNGESFENYLPGIFRYYFHLFPNSMTENIYIYDKYTSPKLNYSINWESATNHKFSPN